MRKNLPVGVAALIGSPKEITVNKYWKSEARHWRNEAIYQFVMNYRPIGPTDGERELRQAISHYGIEDHEFDREKVKQRLVDSGVKPKVELA